MERSKKTVAAQVRFVDVPGGTGSAQGLAALRETDALAVVLRAFGDDPKPAKDLTEVEADLLVADLAALEGGLERAEKKTRTGRRGAARGRRPAPRPWRPSTPRRPLRDAGFSPEDAKILRGYAPLTLKPLDPGGEPRGGRPLPRGSPEGTVGVYAAIEAEVAEMDPEEGARCSRSSASSGRACPR